MQCNIATPNHLPAIHGKYTPVIFHSARFFAKQPAYSAKTCHYLISKILNTIQTAVILCHLNDHDEAFITPNNEN
jgi:hypothetical protein